MVGPTARFIVNGKLPEGVFARDIVHFVAGRYGDFNNRNIEWFGPTIEGLDMAGRFTIATMCVELAAEFALFECDDTTLSFLKGRTNANFTPAFPDRDAFYENTYEIDISHLEPQVVLPDKVPGNVKPIKEVKGIKINQAYIGSCANSRLEDLKVAAEIVKGRDVAPEYDSSSPGLQETYLKALQAGYIATLVESGALVTSSTCGACFGGSMGVLGDNETCISASPRNFKGRMGSPTSRVFWAHQRL